MRKCVDMSTINVPRIEYGRFKISSPYLIQYNTCSVSEGIYQQETVKLNFGGVVCPTLKNKRIFFELYKRVVEARAIVQF